MLLLGNQAGASAGAVQIEWWRCPDSDCLNPVKTMKEITPFTVHVETMLTSLADKIAHRRAPSDPEKSFVNNTSIPVYKMLSVGSAIPGSGLSDLLIERYKAVIAFDYAYTFLARGLKDARRVRGRGRDGEPVGRDAARGERTSDARQARPEDEHLSSTVDAAERVGKAEHQPRIRLHRAADVDQQSDRPGLDSPPDPSPLHKLAAGGDTSSQHWPRRQPRAVRM